MVFREQKKNCLCIVLGFVAGIVLAATIGASVYENGPVARDEGKEEIVVAGVPIRVIDVNEPRTPQVKRAIAMYRNALPFACIFLNAADEIVSYGIMDGNRKLALALFEQERLPNLLLYGMEGVPVVYAMAGDKGWSSVRYVKTTPEHDSDGHLIRYRPVGKMYIDIDFDGQFDAKEILNDRSQRLSQWVFIDGGWKSLGTFDPPIGWREPGHLGVSSHTAIYVEDGRERHLDFEPGIGWKRREESSR